VAKYELIDSLNDAGVDLPRLKMNSDKTFSIAFKSDTVRGTWTADDYGDFTLIDFSNSGEKSQGKIVGSESQPEIEIPIPANFFSHRLKSLTFKRKK